MSSRTACTCCKADALSNPATKIWQRNSSAAATVFLATLHDGFGRSPMNAVIDFPVKPETRPYLDAFARRQSGEPEWLGARRRRALSRFAEQGFPSRRSGAWRYIDLRALAEKPLLPAGVASVVADAATSGQLAEIAFTEAAFRLVLVDGRYAPELSVIEGLPAGVWLGGMTTAIPERADLVRSAIEAPLFDTER